MFFQNKTNKNKTDFLSENKNKKNLSDDKMILYKCLDCSFEEYIPRFIVSILDFFDGGDPTIPPRFSCQICSGHMHPVFYKNRKGITYKI